MSTLERIPTHIEGLDENMQGGIPQGHISIVAGASGAMKSSLPCVNLFLASNTVPNTPLFKPAGANHSAAIASFAAYIPGINTEGGTAVNLFVFLSIVLTQG